MKTIHAIYNILSKNWDVSVNATSERSGTLIFSFVAGDGLAKAKFDNLQFGFNLKLNGEIIDSRHYPSQGQQYISADSSPLATTVLLFDPNRTYQMHLYAENSQNRTEKNIEIIVPKPEQPFNSWTWNDESLEWTPPIAQPKNIPHDWDESTLSWVQRNMPM